MGLLPFPPNSKCRHCNQDFEEHASKTHRCPTGETAGEWATTTFSPRPIIDLSHNTRRGYEDPPAGITLTPDDACPWCGGFQLGLSTDGTRRIQCATCGCNGPSPKTYSKGDDWGPGLRVWRNRQSSSSSSSGS